MTGLGSGVRRGVIGWRQAALGLEHEQAQE